MFIRKDPLFLLMSLILLVVVGFIGSYKNPKSKYKSVVPEHQFPDIDKMTKKSCTMPSNENPFANPTYRDDPNRPPACAYDTVKSEINDAYFSNFEQNPFDFYNNKHSQRQFFSLPNTTIPNDQQAFATWLYGNSCNKVCKENTKICTGTEAFGSG